MLRRQLLAVPLLAACAAGTPHPPSPETPPDAVALRRLVVAERSGVAGPERHVFRDSASFGRFWSRAAEGDLPPVDFEREVVIAAAAGEVPSGGHRISVSRAFLADGTLTVEVIKGVPGPNCVVTQAMSNPVDIAAAIASGIRRWTFVERTVRDAC